MHFVPAQFDDSRLLIGTSIVNRQPRVFPAGGLCRLISPWWFSTILWTMANPRPVPFLRVVKNGSKTFSFWDAGIPAPSSSTHSLRRETEGSNSAPTSIRPPELTAAKHSARDLKLPGPSDWNPAESYLNRISLVQC